MVIENKSRVDELYAQGMGYAKSAQQFVNGKIKSRSLSISMMGMATECLLGCLSEKYDLLVGHASIKSFLISLEPLIDITESIKEDFNFISKKTSVCSGVSECSDSDFEMLNERFSRVVIWLQHEIAV